jgi:hypothetical protein
MEFLPIPVSLNSGIPFRNWVVTRWVRDDRTILEVVIPESDGIRVRPNSGIPGIVRINTGIRRNSGLTEFRNYRN